MSSTGQLIDVIIPTRNRPELTAEAIASVQAQTMTDWRLLVVDDHSTEGHLRALEKVISGDARVVLIRRAEQGGAQVARQTGLEASDALFVAILDSDDLWAPEKLERQLRHYEEHQGGLERLGAILCGHYWGDRAGVPQGEPRQPVVYGRASPLVSDNMSTILIRRDFLDHAGGFLPPGEHSRAGANHIDFYLRLTQECDFAAVPEVLVTCRRHGDQRDSDILGSRAGADNLAYLLERHAAYLERHPRERALLQARTGARYLAVGSRREGLQYLTRALQRADLATTRRLLRQYGPFTVKALVTPRRTGRR